MEIGFAKEAARCSAIAQLVEQATVNRPVVGSSPTRGATFLKLPSIDPSLQVHVHVGVGLFCSTFAGKGPRQSHRIANPPVFAPARCAIL